jgi:hypothetical protein
MLSMVAPQDTSVFMTGMERVGRKSVQDIDGEALETLFQDFDANRGLGRSSRVTDTGPYSYEDTRKLVGDNDGFGGI